MKEDRPLNPKRLREVYSYDAATGIFSRKEKPFRKTEGSITHNGYLKLSVDAVYFRAHRLAWLYHFGEWPKGLLDHKNRDKTDNRISNLRIATKSQNAINCGLPKSNTSGFKGVTFDKSRSAWKAQIMFKSKNIWIGDFATPKKASEAYTKKAVELFGEYFRAS